MSGCIYINDSPTTRVCTVWYLIMKCQFSLERWGKSKIAAVEYNVYVLHFYVGEKYPPRASDRRPGWPTPSIGTTALFGCSRVGISTIRMITCHHRFEPSLRGPKTQFLQFWHTCLDNGSCTPLLLMWAFLLSWCHICLDMQNFLSLTFIKRTRKQFNGANDVDDTIGQRQKYERHASYTSIAHKNKVNNRQVKKNLTTRFDKRRKQKEKTKSKINTGISTKEKDWHSFAKLITWAQHWTRMRSNLCKSHNHELVHNIHDANLETREDRDISDQFGTHIFLQERIRVRFRVGIRIEKDQS